MWIGSGVIIFVSVSDKAIFILLRYCGTSGSDCRRGKPPLFSASVLNVHLFQNYERNSARIRCLNKEKNSIQI